MTAASAPASASTLPAAPHATVWADLKQKFARFCAGFGDAARMAACPPSPGKHARRFASALAPIEHGARLALLTAAVGWIAGLAPDRLRDMIARIERQISRSRVRPHGPVRQPPPQPSAPSSLLIEHPGWRTLARHYAPPEPQQPATVIPGEAPDRRSGRDPEPRGEARAAGWSPWVPDDGCAVSEMTDDGTPTPDDPAEPFFPGVSIDPSDFPDPSGWRAPFRCLAGRCLAAAPREPATPRDAPPPTPPPPVKPVLPAFARPLHASMAIHIDDDRFFRVKKQAAPDVKPPEDPAPRPHRLAVRIAALARALDRPDPLVRRLARQLLRRQLLHAGGQGLALRLRNTRTRKPPRPGRAHDMRAHELRRNDIRELRRAYRSEGREIWRPDHWPPDIELKSIPLKPRPPD